MPPKSKSIFRGPGVKHFQLVHRSQRDPLINDPDASQHVLKAFVRENDKKGKTRAELEDQLGSDLAANPALEKLGKASLYGIYYDDSSYDYMQHLRAVGVYEEGVDSILIEAPSTSKKQSKKGGLDLPQEALPSAYELPRTYESQQAIPQSIAGFQPGMDPHLRQTLEALEDDAFVDDGLEDDFFAELVGEGERDGDEDFGYEFREEGLASDAEEEADQFDENAEATWEDRFAQFKKSQAAKAAKQDNDSDDEFASEGGDTIGTLHTISVIGGKKRRRKGGSDATGYSMSSSSMPRHEGLKTLDERFDQMMLREYENDEEGEEDEEEHSDADSDEAPELITSRDDFDGMINEFLNDYEILGRKMRPKLEGETGPDKLGAFRRAVGVDERVRIMREGEEDDPEEEIPYMQDEPVKDRWDCETILSTYSNLENHPRLIRARTSKPVPKITLDPRTGLPIVEDSNSKPATKRNQPKRQPLSNSEDTDSSDSDATTTGTRKAAVGRPRNETAEEKKARKLAVKQQKQSRRVEKKATKEQFSAEIRGQMKRLPASDVKMKKL